MIEKGNRAHDGTSEKTREGYRKCNNERKDEVHFCNNKNCTKQGEDKEKNEQQQSEGKIL